MKIKICGVRQLVDGQAALAAGADLLGFVFYPPSPRYLSPPQARALIAALRSDFGPHYWLAVGVFVNSPTEWVNDVASQCALDYVQLHGTEPPLYCAAMRKPVIKALRLPELPPPPVNAAQFGASRLLIDTAVPGLWGGTGQRLDWRAAAPYAPEAIIAGGLTPDNVADAVQLLHPWGLDVSSGVERDGSKDPALIASFIRRARAAEMAP